MGKNLGVVSQSYDRSGGNGDSGNFLSTTGGVAVLADVKGPGAVVRIWSANPQRTLKIYIDDNPAPVIQMPFAKLFDNSTPPFTNPIAGQSSGGFYSYLPITFAKHCVITTEVLDYYYQVNYVTYLTGTAVRPFALPIMASDQAALASATAYWSDNAVPATLPGLSATQAIQPMQTLTLGEYKGAGEITHVRMRFQEQPMLICVSARRRR